MDKQMVPFAKLVYPALGSPHVTYTVLYTCQYNLRLSYILNQLFEGPKHLFLRCFFLKCLALCVVSIQVRVLIKSGLRWWAYGM